MDRSEKFKEVYKKNIEGYRSGSKKLTEKHQNIYNLNPKLCARCQTPIPYAKRRDKFCSKDCWRETLSGNKHGQKYSKDKTCPVCGTMFGCYKKRANKYCSIECFHAERRTKLRQELVENKCREPRRLKNYLIEIRGHGCELCKNTTWQEQPIPLVLDHVDGNSENNELVNLRLVCGNCDMQLPTYKSKNRGNGRAWRRQRYADNKSY